MSSQYMLLSLLRNERSQAKKRGRLKIGLHRSILAIFSPSRGKGALIAGVFYSSLAFFASWITLAENSDGTGS